MQTNQLILTALGAVVLVAGAFLAGERHANAQAAARVYELRTYTTYDGKLPDLLARFRNHTTKLFEQHHMTNVGYFVPKDAPESGNTLIYLLAHPSREEAMKNWKEFGEDPVWVKARDASEANGKINQKVERKFLDPTDFSGLK